MLKNRDQAAVVIFQSYCQSRRSWVQALPAESRGRVLRLGQAVDAGFGPGRGDEVVDHLGGLVPAALADQEQRGFGDAAADPEHQQRRQHHDQHGQPPVPVQGHEPGGHEAAQRGADRPPAVHRGEDLAALLAGRELAHQRVVHRDAAAQAEAGHKAERDEPEEVGGEGAQHGEEREDQQRGGEGLFAPDRVRDGAPDEGAQGHADQVRGADPGGLARAEGPVLGQQRNQDAVERDVPGVEHKAQAADQEDPALHLPAPGQFLDHLFAAGHSGVRIHLSLLGKLYVPARGCGALHTPARGTGPAR